MISKLTPKKLRSRIPHHRKSSLLVESLECRRLLAGDLVHLDSQHDLRPEPVPFPGSVHGTKWLDENGDGHRDATEPGLPGVVVYSDLNRNGKFDRGEPATRTMRDDPDTDFDEAGLYWLDGLRPGVHIIREIVPDGFLQTFPSTAIGPDAQPAHDQQFVTVDPQFINLHLEPGESEETQVSITIHPLCVRPFQIEVVPSDPDVEFSDGTGILVNGCGGDTSTFDIKLGGDGEPRRFELQFVDAEFGQTLATIPVAIRDGSHRVVVESGQSVERVDFGNRPLDRTGSVHGTKWLDHNGNGEREPDEPGIPGVIVYSDRNGNQMFDRGEPATRTMRDDPRTDFDEGGMYWLDGLAPGDHNIREIVPHGFEQTFPLTPSHQVSVEAGVAVENVHFGNRPLRRGAIEGRKWVDRDGDGRRDPDEPGLPGVVIFVDINNNGAFDRGEPATRTQADNPHTAFDESGLYRIGGLAAGQYIVREIQPDGYRQTFPPSVSTVYSSTTVRHQQGVALDFDVTDIDVAPDGTTNLELTVVWPDSCGSLITDMTSHVVVGNQIFVSMHGEQIGNVCAEVITPESQTISIAGLAPGNYGVFGRLHERMDDGFITTLGVNARVLVGGQGHHVVDVSHGQVAGGLDFGNRPVGPGSIHGIKWLDGNGDGQRQRDELGLPGVTLYVDANRNGEFDKGEPHAVSMRDDPDTDFDESGHYWIENVRPGVHVVREVVPDGFVQTFPPAIIVDAINNDDVAARGRFHVVVVRPNESVEGIHFGNRPRLPGSIHGLKWEDTNGNGQRDPKEPGLPGVTIYLDVNFNGRFDEGEPRAITMRDDPDTVRNESGHYWLQDVEPGFYVVREVVPDGFEQTFPRGFDFDLRQHPTIDLPFIPDGAHFVRLGSGEVIEDIDFGNQRLDRRGSVHGTKWLDRNGNGERDANEPGLPGVVIYSDLNNNGRLDPDEPRTRSMRDDPITDFDEAGMYWLENLEAGRHVIREIVPDGFQQTFPNSAIFAANVDSQTNDNAFATVNPEAIGLHLAAGEVKQTSVSMTIHPFCFRSYEIDVIASDPSVSFSNLTGILLNGCGGDTSTFDVQIEGDGLPHQFEIQFVDFEFGDILGAIPVTINDGSHRVLVEGGSAVEGIDFGNQPIRDGSVHGTKWHDRNGNGQRDPDEPGLPGVVIYSDLNNNGRLDQGEPATRTMRDIPETDFDEAGMYWLEGLSDGSHTIREIVPDGFRQTFPRGPLSDAASVVDTNVSDFASVTPGLVDMQLDAGEIGNTNVSITIHPFCFRPFNIDVVASDPDINLANETGILVNGCGGDTSSFDIAIEGDGLSHSFELQFVDADFGGVLATIPVLINNGGHRVFVRPGTAVQGIDFGNQRVDRRGSVHGTKWLDENGNGERDPDEPGLAGVIVYSDLNRNNRLDSGEPATRTMDDDPDTVMDESGRYWLEGLAPGRHIIREIVPDGFRQTFPPTAPGMVDVLVDSDSFSVDPRFLNLGLADGEAITTDVEITIHPFCFRPYEIDVVASDPGISFSNNTGVLVNGCGGDTSNFEIELKSDGLPHRFELQFVDAEFGDTLATIPVTINDGSHAVFVEPGSAVEGVDFGNQPRDRRGSIHGTKWNDLNGNGQRESNEPGLPGVVIYSDLNNNGVFDRGEPVTRTMRDDPQTAVDESGHYWLENLRPGVHIVREVVPDGFVQTFPRSGDEADGAHIIDLEPGEAVEGIDFGNSDPRGSIHGVKWNDRNGNRERDPHEPGIPGVVIYSDLNGNGVLDRGEPATRTMRDDPRTDVDESGRYWLEKLSPGNHLVREIVPDGFVQTFPVNVDGTPAPHLVPLDRGGHVEGVDFGNRRIDPRGSVHGTKWLDRNGNGQRDVDEPGLPGVVVYSDLNNNGRLDRGEPATRTMENDPNTVFDEAGMYWLEDLVPGRHLIREIVPDGFVQTFPPGVVVNTDNVEAGDGTITVAPESLHLFLDDGEMTTTTVSFTFHPFCVRPFMIDVIASDPDIDFSNLTGVLVNGCGGDTSEFDIKLSGDGLSHSFDLQFVDAEFGGVLATMPVTINNGAHRVIVEPGSAVEAIDFGNAPVDRPGSVHGTKWLDRNANGERDRDEPGLPGVVIFSDLNGNGVYDRGEPATRTMRDDPNTDFDESGLYWLEGLKPGRHLIREIVPHGFEQTFPFDGGSHQIVVESGTAVEGIDFGNRPMIRPGSVHGTKWFDRNGNSERDPNEPGLPGVVIYSDVNRNGRFDEGEPATRSMRDDPQTDFDESGMYWLEDLDAGTHIIREVVPDGFRQTFPPSNGGADIAPVALEENAFATVNPQLLNLQLVDGQVADRNVSITIHPFCFRPYEIDVVASDPNIRFQNSTGVVLNGCGGDTSSFDVKIEGDGLTHHFDLQFVDAEFGGVLATIPVLINVAGGHRVHVEPGSAVEGIDFGNQPIPQGGGIEGRKWLDINGNGERDSDEPGLPGVTIYLDLNHNGELDPGEPSTTTAFDNPLTDVDESGRYRFHGLTPGPYEVREVEPDGFQQTFPETFSTVLSSETGRFQPGIALDFDVTDVNVLPSGVTELELTVVWPDSCGSIITGATSHTVIGNDIFVNMQGEQVGTVCAEVISPESQTIEVSGLSPGPYTVNGTLSEHLNGNVIPTLAVLSQIVIGGQGSHRIIVERDQIVADLNFGNQPSGPGSVHGLKWMDINGDGRRQDNEPGLPGVTIYVDLNRDRRFNDNEPHAVSMKDDPETDFDESGHYWIDDVRPGVHIVREVVPDGFVQTFPPVLVVDPLPGHGLPLQGRFHVVTVRPGQAVEGIDFGNQPIRPGSIHGTKWYDRNGNGRREDYEPGVPGVKIYLDLNRNGKLDDNEPHTVTMKDDPDTDVNEAGMYWLDGVRPGTHSVREVVPDGFVQTFPRNSLAPRPIEFVGAADRPGDHIVIVRSGEKIEGIDFGNRRRFPFVEHVRINNGASQRSMVRSITVFFDREVKIEEGAFHIWNRSTNTEFEPNVAISVEEGRTIAVLTFNGDGIRGGSLTNGNYKLTIDKDKVHDGDQNMEADHVDCFFRYFGDYDGDRDVDARDFREFRRAFRRLAHEEGYNEAYDFDNDGDVDARDFREFRRIFRTSLDANPIEKGFGESGFAR